MRREIGLIQTCSAVILVLATFMTREVDSRLPPKLLKVASGASKALYARGYGYSVIPIPQKILLQTNVARRVVHHPRPKKSKRPRRGPKRPPSAYAAKYQDYRPSKKRRPPPPNRDPPPEYSEEREPDEDFEYDDRGYNEFEDFVSKHSELYADGYNSRGKPPRNRYKDEDAAFSENSGFVYSRRPRPSRSGRPSTKLYSAAIALPNRYQREEEYEEEEDEGYSREHYNSNRGGRYRDEEEEDDGYYLRDRYRDWNPDDVYHDRKYETRQEKFRRAADDGTRMKSPKIQKSERSKKSKNSSHSDRPIWQKENGNLKYQGERSRSSGQAERYRWKDDLQQEEEIKWKEPFVEQSRFEPIMGRVEQMKTETIKLGDEGRWRSPESLGLGQFYGNEPKVTESEEWKEPEIITKQNAGRWEARHQSGQKYGEPSREEGWIKEHNVGYGIEIDGGGGGRKKKVEAMEPDVVYGHSGYSKPRVPADLRYEQSSYGKPRVPDLGYGQGMELADGKAAGWEVYLRR